MHSIFVFLFCIWGVMLSIFWLVNLQIYKTKVFKQDFNGTYFLTSQIFFFNQSSPTISFSLKFSYNLLKWILVHRWLCFSQRSCSCHLIVNALVFFWLFLFSFHSLISTGFSRHFKSSSLLASILTNLSNMLA